MQGKGIKHFSGYPIHKASFPMRDLIDLYLNYKLRLPETRMYLEVSNG